MYEVSTFHFPSLSFLVVADGAAPAMVSAPTLEPISTPVLDRRLSNRLGSSVRWLMYDVFTCIHFPSSSFFAAGSMAAPAAISAELTSADDRRDWRRFGSSVRWLMYEVSTWFHFPSSVFVAAGCAAAAALAESGASPFSFRASKLFGSAVRQSIYEVLTWFHFPSSVFVAVGCAAATAVAASVELRSPDERRASKLFGSAVR
mmetsp:Transcript_12239/g.21280  ORF Transcript_12239/g.21280 Transcript_12239/m.21280 type:complete len:203 (+) Transcript_12239:440-1048(+)